MIEKASSRGLVLAALGLSVLPAFGCSASSENYSNRPSANASPLVKWPTPAGNKPTDHTIRVPTTFDGEMMRYYGVDELEPGPDENPPPMFDLSDGAVLSNVIMGDPVEHGVLCRGSCTINN